MRYFKHFSCRTWDFINVSPTKKRDPNKDKTTKHREIPEHLDLGIWVKSWGTSKVGWLVDLEYQNILKKNKTTKYLVPSLQKAVDSLGKRSGRSFGSFWLQ